jgi:hypothetical protein
VDGKSFIFGGSISPNSRQNILQITGYLSNWWWLW